MDTSGRAEPGHVGSLVEPPPTTNALPVAVLTLSLDGVVRYANPRLYTLLELAPGALESAAFDHILTTASGVLYQSYLLPLLKLHGRVEEFRLELRGPRGQPIAVLAYAHLREHSPDGEARVDLVLAIINERRRVEDDLLRIRQAAELAPVMLFQQVVRADGSTCMPYATNVLRTLYGLTPQHVRDSDDALFARVHPEDRGPMIAARQRASQGRGQWQTRYRVTLEDGRVRVHELVANSRDMGDGETHWHGVIVDVSDRLALAASEDRFEELFNLAPQALLTIDLAGRVVRSNRAAAALFGRSTQGLEGCAAVDVLPALTPERAARETFPPTPIGGRDEPAEEWVAVRHDGQVLRTEVRLARASVEGREHYLVSVTDVSERVATLEAVERSLREKQVLLKEIHHRVKNNLQIISSLLRLQCDRLAAVDAKAPFEESIGRVRSMAVVHEHLYGHDSLEEIDLGDYARNLGGMLRGSYAPDARLRIEADPVRVPIDLATPLGLILNELITNAFKHGRAQRGDGGQAGQSSAECEVLVEVQKTKEGVRLVVSDSGPGLVERPRTNPSNSLGMQLLRSLSRQLRGTLRFENEGGLRVSVECPVR